MTSRINKNNPTNRNPAIKSIRDNFIATATDIEELQDNTPKVNNKNLLEYGNITNPIATLSYKGTVKESGSNKISNPLAKAFREAGGIVACYYYGEWRQQSVSYNRFPWKWFVDYQDRLPLPSVKMPAYPIWTFSTQLGYIGWTVSSITRSIAPDGAMRLTSNSADPILYSPSIVTPGEDINAITIVIKKISTGINTWDGRIYFTTQTDSVWNAEKSFVITQPTWDTEYKTIKIVTSSNTIWTSSVIQSLRFDFAGFSESVETTFDIKSIELNQSRFAKFDAERVMGLPSEQQWAVDWEIKTAYDHGIDVFVHNYYWNGTNGVSNMNHQKYNLDLHAASNVRPDMKFCIQWSNHEGGNTIPTTASLNPLLDDWYSYFSNNRYWKIDGKPVIYIFSIGLLRTWCQTTFSTTGAESGKAFVNYVNAYFAAKSNSLAPNGIYFVSEGAADHPFWWGKTGNAKAWLEYSGFSAGTRYNQFNANTNQTPIGNQTTGIQTGGGEVGYPSNVGGLTSYEKLREVHRKTQDWCINVSNSGIPYWSPAMMGWDKRPWITYTDSGTFKESWNCICSPEDFTGHLIDVRDCILNAKNDGKYPWVPTVNIFAWNEYGEGGYICPTRRYGFSLLESVLETFGPCSS